MDSSNKITIKIVSVKELTSFAQEVLLDAEKYLIQPIDQIRALAHSKNPHADPDDIGLVVAYDKDRCIGYTGVITSTLRYQKKSYKIYAHTTFYVDPSFRTQNQGKTIGEMMIECILSTGNGLITTGLSNAAEKFFKRNVKNFVALEPLQYCVLPLRKCQPCATFYQKIRTKLKLRFISSVLKKLSTIGQYFIDQIIWFFIIAIIPKKFKNDSFKFKEIDRFQPLSEYEQRQENINSLYLLRNHDTINWMLNYLWLIISPENLPSNYFFEVKRESFYFKAYEIQKMPGHQSIGYFTLSLSTKNQVKTLKLLDSNIYNEEYSFVILIFLLRNAFNWKVNYLYLPFKYYEILKSLPRLKNLVHLEKRGYFISLPKALSATNPFLFKTDFCDCDRSFT